MFKIVLIEMPFSSLGMPSIALTQLRSVLRKRFADTVSVQVLYLSHDFAKFLGVASYKYISNSMECLNTGFGEWFFRQEAFPQLSNNADIYFRRYFPRVREAQVLHDLVIQKRAKLGEYIENLISLYKLDDANIVGFTSMFMQNLASFALAKRLKQRNANLITVMGGSNCEFPMGEVIAKQVGDIDFTFSGPALKSFPDFVQYCLAGEIASCDSIRGVFSKSPIPKNGAETVGDDLDIDTPMELDYDSFIRRIKRYFLGEDVEAFLPFETSRGCWWGQRSHCTFCGLNGASMSYRAMRPDLAIEQFKSLFQYSGKVAGLAAVDNILPKSYLREVFPNLQTPKEMRIFYEVKADLTEEELAVLAKARVTRIQPGIEALITSTLKLMKKGTTAFQNLRLLQLCVKYGVNPYWNLLIGFPGEGEETYKRYAEILPLLFHLPPPSGVYPVRFDRFSPYHSHAEEYGLELHPVDFYSLIYPFSEAELDKLAYFFADKRADASYAQTMARWLPTIRSLVDLWIRRWNSSEESRAHLHLTEDGGAIDDSRSGQVVLHPLTLTAKAILERLAKPTRHHEAVARLQDEFGQDVADTIASLEKIGVIFREEDRLMSLVSNDTVDNLPRGDYGNSSQVSLKNEFQILNQSARAIAQ